MYKAAEYYELIAKPTVEEFFSAVDDPRRGMLACMVLLHTIDHVYQNRMQDSAAADRAAQAFAKDASADTHLGASRLYFAVVRGFALASKHARLTGKGLNPGFGSKDYEVAAPALVDDFEIDGSFIEDEVGGVTIRWCAGSFVNLKEALISTMRTLEAEFHELQQPGPRDLSALSITHPAL